MIIISVKPRQKPIELGPVAGMPVGNSLRLSYSNNPIIADRKDVPHPAFPIQNPTSPLKTCNRVLSIIGCNSKSYEICCVNFLAPISVYAFSCTPHRTVKDLSSLKLPTSSYIKRELSAVIDRSFL